MDDEGSSGSASAAAAVAAAAAVGQLTLESEDTEQEGVAWTVDAWSPANVSFTAEPETDCAAFVAGLLQPGLCQSCKSRLAQHARAAVSSSELRRALSAGSDTRSAPSCVYTAKVKTEVAEVTEAAASLFVGGFRSLLHRPAPAGLEKAEAEAGIDDLSAGVSDTIDPSPRFLSQTLGVRRIVIVAKSMRFFGPVYARHLATLQQSAGVLSMHLPWLDEETQAIDREELHKAILFIHDGLCERSSVLVHCSKGRSRSATVALAYMLTLQPAVPLLQHLASLQAVRPIVQPNKGFMAQLERLQSDGFFETLHSEILSE
eukprot:m.13595 g.13595  ORF g.13595 m.13595 type:complete len:317 (+) comp6910_c0_seq1:119-1069(+)